MVSLFGKLLKLLPVAGALLLLTAVGRSLHQGVMDQVSLTLIVLGFVLFLAMFLKVESASLRYYLNLSVVTALTLGNLSLIYLIAQNHPGRWDLTSNNRLSLSQQTRDLLGHLRYPIKLRVTSVKNEPISSYLNLFAQANDRVTFEIVNPYKDLSLFSEPGEEARLNTIEVSATIDGQEIKNPDKVAFKGEGDLSSLSILEEPIVNAIMAVTRDKATRLYVVDGRGSKTPQRLTGDNAEKRSFSTFSEELVKRSIDVRLLMLQVDKMVPDDCDVLVIAGPTEDLAISEVEAVAEYLNRGGSLLVLLDPTENLMDSRQRLRFLLATYGLNVSPDLLCDAASHKEGFTGLAPVIREFSPYHPITENLQGTVGQLPLEKVCTATQAEQTPPGLKFWPLLQSTEKSWIVSLRDFQYDRNKSLAPPPEKEMSKRVVAMAVGPEKKQESELTGQSGPRLPRIVFFGDSDFLTNAQLAIPQMTLGYRAVTWLTQQEDLFNLKPPTLESQPISLERKQHTLLSMFSVVILPFSIFFGGLAYTTLRRRKR
ncbi:MAG TPA: Gldg family protein [Candidatus Sumerlaeota bacterium]|nr:Gldg family protein [Candidatus Sumerlaeota bacterium]